MWQGKPRISRERLSGPREAVQLDLRGRRGMSLKDPGQNADSQAADAGKDAFADDLFGQNIRSMWDVFFHPRQYFEAARHRNWTGKYAPSVRVVLALAAIMSSLRYFWAGDNSAMIAMYETGLKDIAVLLELTDVKALAVSFMSKFLILYPLIYVFFHMIGAFLLRIWGPGTHSGLRMRLYFAGLIPAGVFGVLLSVVYRFASEAGLNALNVGALAFVFVLYVLTIARSFEPVTSRAHRWGRGLAFGTVAIILDLTIGIACMLGTIIWLTVERVPAIA
jgi:hypothetical protein